MASRLFHIYDVRNMSKPMQERESSLKYMTRSLACYATASVEGRIAVEYFDPSPEVQEKKYAFKCHRQTVKEVDQASGKEQEVDHVWPVNGLAFCPRYNTFASAGSDGTVSIWDFKVKKRLRQYPKFPNPVSAIGFSCDGGKLAIAASYTWDEGEHGLKSAKAPWLGVRRLGDEVRPKGWGKQDDVGTYSYMIGESFTQFFDGIDESRAVWGDLDLITNRQLRAQRAAANPDNSSTHKRKADEMDGSADGGDGRRPRKVVARRPTGILGS
ncbi:other/FunK1 protein kinase [Coprinopsis cinerea AmutBmut pab1-1]|nr:other/FunK1 protein kinase [Coprinopsis cinerea AmutBmut pab1-1]